MSDGLGDWDPTINDETPVDEVARRLAAIEAGLASVLNILDEFLPLARRAAKMMDSPAMKVKEALLGGSRIRK